MTCGRTMAVTKATSVARMHLSWWVFSMTTWLNTLLFSLSSPWWQPQRGSQCSPSDQHHSTVRAYSYCCHKGTWECLFSHDYNQLGRTQKRAKRHKKADASKCLAQSLLTYSACCANLLCSVGLGFITYKTEILKKSFQRLNYPSLFSAYNNICCMLCTI